MEPPTPAKFMIHEIADQVIAKYDFKSRQNDELSLQKGDKLKLLEKISENEDWVKADLNGKKGYVPVSYIDIDKAWFRPKMKRDEARDLLLKMENGHHLYPDGAFIIRSSVKAPGGYSLSVKTGNQVQHFMIFRDPPTDQQKKTPEQEFRGFYLWEIQYRFKTLSDLIEFYKTSSVHQTDKIFLRDLEKQPPRDKRKRVVAKYKFVKEQSDELTLSPGDVIAVIDMDSDDAHWMKGEVIQGAEKGKTGLFPKNYVADL